jgi:hypothetical protein
MVSFSRRRRFPCPAGSDEQLVSAGAILAEPKGGVFLRGAIRFRVRTPAALKRTCERAALARLLGTQDPTGTMITRREVGIFFDEATFQM